MILNRNYIFLALAILLTRCASIQTPTGGDKDITPPKVVHYSPDSAGTMASPTQIVIEFDEYIQLKNLQSQLLISPPVDPRPALRIKGKKLILDLGDELEINTTYQFNFGDAILDNNEGNVLSDFNLVFSTGPYLDSLKLNGNVRYLKTGEPVPKCVVMLYKDYNDSTLLKDDPYYVTRTDDSGTYNFHHLAAGDYFLVALEDKDQNYRLSKDEEVALYSKTSIQPQGQSLDLMVSPNQPQRPYRIKSADNPDVATYRLTFEQELAPNDTVFLDINYDDLRKQTWIPNHFGVSRDTFYFFTPERTDTTTLLGTALMKRGQDYDTAEIKIKTKSRKITRSAGLKIVGPSMIIPEKPLTIQTSRPILKLTTNNQSKNLKLIEDSTEVTTFKILPGKRRDQFIIDYPFKSAKTYKLVTNDSLLTDLFGNQIPADTLLFKSRSKENFGNLKFSVDRQDSTDVPVILELMKRDQVYNSYTLTPKDSSRVISITYLEPGTYGFRYFFDTNSNGQWDAGDIVNRIDPENWVNLSKTTEVRAGWSVEDIQILIK